MKKYYCITILALLVVTLLQGYNVSWINKGEVVPRQDLKDTVWRGVKCSEESQNNVMYNLRRYFAKDASIHLETLRGEGFKMWMDD
jgi:DNA-binding winged helix-turn-helix (wHTH) protein